MNNSKIFQGQNIQIYVEWSGGDQSQKNRRVKYKNDFLLYRWDSIYLLCVTNIHFRPSDLIYLFYSTRPSKQAITSVQHKVDHLMYLLRRRWPLWWYWLRPTVIKLQIMCLIQAWDVSFHQICIKSIHWSWRSLGRNKQTDTHRDTQDRNIKTKQQFKYRDTWSIVAMVSW